MRAQRQTAFGGLLALWLVAVLALRVGPVQAQGQCAPITTVVPPVDPAAFQIVQDYAARSPRHHGRYHTGEDWAFSNGQGEGQPVWAIASGRVTYSEPQGWGRDGGVVIIEHTLPDGTLAYSMYGHMMDSALYPFPADGICVAAGDVVGAVGDARPAPHLHFEIRIADGRTPGPGYTWEAPASLGFRDPSNFLVSWQARLLPPVEWVTTLSDANGDPAEPVVLDDNSLLVLDARRIMRVLPDGRPYWRTTPDRQPVALTAFQGRSLVHYADGSVQEINPEGTLGESWQTEALAVGAPFRLDDLLVFPQPGGGLVALGPDRRGIAWETPNTPPFVHAHASADTLALVTADNTLVTLARESRTVIDTAHLRSTPSLATANDGTLLVYSMKGAWRVLADGTWEAFGAPQPTGGWAVGAGEQGETLLFDGDNVRNIGRGGVEQWAYPVAGVTGRTEINWLDGRALLISEDGAIATVGPLGQVCQLAIPGARRAAIWYALGTDGLLRVKIGGSLVGIDWAEWKSECPI